jgi:hypothetical protein
MIHKIFDQFRQNDEPSTKYVVNCNPSSRLQLSDAIALRQKVMTRFPQSERFGDTFCFAIAAEDVDAVRVSELEPAIRLSALELGLSLPVEFKVQPCVSPRIARNGLPAAADPAAHYTTAA